MSQWCNQYEIGDEVRVNAYGGQIGIVTDVNYEDESYDVDVDGDIDTYTEDELS